MTHTVAQRCILFGVLVVLLGGIMFLTSSPSQETEHTVTQETTEPTLPNRPPEGYQVPLRPEVTFPFTHVSADRLRLANVRKIPDNEKPVLIRSSGPGSKSPDGQWKLVNPPDIAITRTDGSGETRVLFKDDSDSDRDIVSYGEPLTWSWDSNRIFYEVSRTYYVDENRLNRESERWVESVDIATGEITRHTDIGYRDDLYSYATARYPDDPVLHYDYDSWFDYDGWIISVGTRNGSTRWVIDYDIRPVSLSPNKQMILTDRSGGDSRFVYAIDGSGLLYSLSVGVDDFVESADGFRWSPDSTKIAYHKIVEREDGTGIPSISDLYLIDADGTGRTQLTDTPDTPEGIVGWTLDGQIVFRVFREGLYLADLVTE